MGEILLDWEGHNKALSNKLWEFFKEEYLVDFNVTCHGQQKKVHKFVLALLFPMLKESLWSTDPLILDRGEPVKDESSRMLWTPQCLNLDNIADHAEDMDYLIQFAYTGKTTVPNEHADCLVRISTNMDIQCLKDSLDRGATARSARKDLSEPINTTLGRLRPRSHLKNIQVIEDSVSSYDYDDDDYGLDVHSTMDEESNLNVVEYSDSNEGRPRNSKKKIITSQKRVPQKRRRTDDHVNEKQSQNSPETLQKLTKTDSKIEGDNGAPSNEQTRTQSKSKEKKLLKCPQCEYVAKFPNRLHRHLASHIRKQAKDQKLLPGEEEEDEANAGEPSNEQAKNMSNDEGKKHLKCSQCDYVAKYPTGLLRHLGSHVRKLARGPRRPNTCTTCKKAFENRQLLEAHRDSKCGTEPLICKYCGHRTSLKMTLRHHMIAMHQVDAEGNPLEKNIKCSDCDFVCYARHQLRAHERAKHERKGKFKCKECSFTAPYIKDLLRHERTKHQNISDYMCEECGYRYKSRGRLNRHVLIRHKGIKPHKCNICNAEYSDSLSFRIHMQRHEGKVEYKFVCHICGHNLRRKYELKTHLRKKHGIEMQEEVAITVEPGFCQLQQTEKSTSIL